MEPKTQEPEKEESKPEFVLDGNNIHDEESFYIEVENKLTKNFRSGRNLDAFNDILRGGFGVDYIGFKPVILRWTNFTASSATIAKKRLNIILEIINEADDITFIPEN